MKQRKGFRRIVVDKINWQYKIGRVNVIAYSEVGTRICDNFSTITGIADYNLRETEEELSWDGRLIQRYVLLPSVIEKWIRKTA